MGILAIGDVQGCYDQLMRVLERAQYDERRDVLWFVGDLVNRGPKSAQTVRFAMKLGARQVTVLGNHELALLVCAAGLRKKHRGDTFDDILEAPDREEMLDWLRRLPLVHAEGAWTMVHAGLLPQWTVPKALALAREVEAVLAGPGYLDFLRGMFGNEPTRWGDELTGLDRLRVITNAMTRIRLVTSDGRMDFAHKRDLASAPAGYLPWYDVAGRASRDTTVLFGHWAGLGLVLRDDVICLDSGCVWGRSLSALWLENRQLVQCDCGELAGTASEE